MLLKLTRYEPYLVSYMPAKCPGNRKKQVHQDQEKKPFCPLVFLQCPVLAKLKTVPAGKGEMFQDHQQAKNIGLVSERQFIDNCYS